VTDLFRRRDFIKSISLAGASIALADNVSANSFLPADNAEIKNAFFTISFDQKKGTINVERSSGKSLLTGGVVGFNTSDGKQDINPDNYRFKSMSRATDERFGRTEQLIIQCIDRREEWNVEIYLSLYERVNGIVVEVICKNVSPKDLILKSIEPIRAIKGDGGGLNVHSAAKCITNGEMYFDAGMIHEFGTKNKPDSSEGIKGIQLNNKSIDADNETIHSWWNAGIFGGYNEESVVLGYLENTLCLGNISLARTALNQISFVAESLYTPGAVVKPGKSMSSNRFMINIAANPYAALENYADVVGKLNNARTKSIINGWCSWFYTLTKVSEEEVVASADFAAKHLRPYGLEYIQVDEGYQKWHGEWEGNERFPHGMKWLADKIKTYGFRAGIWISPYVISEPTELFREHPDWLVKSSDGTLQRVGNWQDPPPDENPKRYCLDITHPEAAQWLYNLIDTIANKWGFEMIKIDFVAWSTLSANRFYDPTFSAAQVYRKGMETMRKAAGDKCHILECGPGAITVGLIDSMRIEWDINYGYADTAWGTYFTHPAGSASAEGKRYYFHKRTWINDADHLCMDLLNNQQSEAAATLIALSGGNMMSGDRLAQLDPYKLEILKKVLPSTGNAAVPIDLFDNDMQSVFAVRVKKSFGEWVVIGFFNGSLTDTVEKKFSLDRLGLAHDNAYLAFDFWKQQYVGEISRDIKVAVQPGTVALLTLHEKSGNPQFISTDRHVLQGAMEIENASWDGTIKKFSGISTGPLLTSHNVFVYLPKDYPWTWGSDTVLFHEHDSYNYKLVDNHIVRVHLNFDKSERIEWQIDLNELAK